MTRSFLELALGGLPFPHGNEDGAWAYRHAVRPDGPTELDAQAVADFRRYEGAHGREVIVRADPELSDWSQWQLPAERVSPAAFPTQCCTHAFPQGCGSRFVCHGAPAAVAAQIVTTGVLRSASSVVGRSGAELAATSTWGEPPDYFDHVMFANGRCTAPEAVALSRRVGHDLEPSDLTPGYPPAVRFYFDWNILASRGDARFDGVHPVKIFDALPLDEVLIAIVVHVDDLEAVGSVVPPPLIDRLVVSDMGRPRPEDWSTVALDAVEKAYPSTHDEDEDVPRRS